MGFNPSPANCAAMYLAASSPPRVAGPRPSSKSSARKAVWARSRSGVITFSASSTAGGRELSARAMAASMSPASDTSASRNLVISDFLLVRMQAAIIARRLTRRAEEAQHGVALPQRPNAGKCAVGFLQGSATRVLGHHPGVGRQHGRLAQQAERALVFLSGLVRRVEEDEVEPHAAPLELAQPGQHVEGQDFGAGLDFESLEVLADALARRTVVFEEVAPFGAAAQSFQAHRARAGVAVGHHRARHRRAQHVEERFAQAVAGGSGVRAAQGLELAALVASRDDAHETASGHLGQAVAALPEAPDVIEGGGEVGRGRGDGVESVLLGAGEQLVVAQEVGDAEAQVAVLARAEELTRAAQFQIQLGDLEAVLRLGQRLQALAGHFADLSGRHQDAGGGVPAAPDAPAQLVELL